MKFHTLLSGLALAAALLPAGAQEPAAPGIVATVNGVSLTEVDFWRRCERYVGGQTDTAVGWVVLKDWIQQTLAEAEAESKKLLPTDQDVERRFQALKKQFEFRNANFINWLTDHGQTVTSLRVGLRHQLIAERLLTEGITVAESEAALYYSSNKQAFGLPEQVKVSRITVTAPDLRQKVEAGLKKGTPFDILAREFSEDDFALSGGLIPEPVEADPRAPGPIEPEVMTALLKSTPAKVLGPVKIRDYWVWARLEERQAARAPALGDIQDLVLANLRVQKVGPEKLKAAQERLAAIQKSAKIEILRPEFKSLLDLLQPKESK